MGDASRREEHHGTSGGKPHVLNLLTRRRDSRRQEGLSCCPEEKRSSVPSVRSCSTLLISTIYLSILPVLVLSLLLSLSIHP